MRPSEPGTSSEDGSDMQQHEPWTVAEADHLVQRFLRVALDPEKSQLTIWFCRGPQCHSVCENGDSCREELCHAQCGTAQGKVKGMDLLFNVPLVLRKFVDKENSVKMGELTAFLERNLEPSVTDQDVRIIWAELKEKTRTLLFSKIAGSVSHPIDFPVWWHLGGPASAHSQVSSEGAPRTSSAQPADPSFA
ncbi:hypothetical protein QFC22_003987 [Naganishia vaughanmartiniae]|uniref:Uncharacterized protein n=1 Tax=Naganishia vaughanmartiniae TaxID=1424756 RepID=A0ACC2X6T1_9TREE|nr:hypothetical protein QFC22_003987 [Naganishia vaughanmartiniae]